MIPNVCRAISLAVLVDGLTLVHDRGVGAHHGLLLSGICLCMTMLPNSYLRDPHNGSQVTAMWIDQGKWFFSLLLLVVTSVAMLAQGPSVLQAEFVLFALIGISGYGRRIRMAMAGVVFAVAAVGLCGLRDDALPVAHQQVYGRTAHQSFCLERSPAG